MEKRVLYHLLRDGKYIDQLILRNVKVECFLLPGARTLFTILLWHYQQYRMLLSREVLVRALERSLRLRDEDKREVLALFEELQTMSIDPKVSFEWFLDELVNKKMSDVYHDALAKAVTTFRLGDFKKSWQELDGDLASLRLIGRHDVREGSVAENAIARLERYREMRDHPEQFRGILIGLPSFDRLTGGLFGGDFGFVIGRTAAGKSTLLLNIGHNVTQLYGKNVLYIIIEMSKDRVEMRWDALDTGLSLFKLTRGLLETEEEKKYEEALKRLSEDKSKGTFYIFDVPSNCTASLIEAKINELSQVYQFDLVLVDYLGIMSAERRNESLWQQLRNIAIELKELARRKSVPVFSAAQVSKSGVRHIQRQRYEVEDVALSYEMAPQADIVLSLRVLDEEALEFSGVCEVNVAVIKNRGGPRGKFKLRADFDKMKMEEPVLRLTSGVGRSD